MSLGWGLRGYIGGGPFGAMIPGALVALVLCRLLALSPQRTALVAAFGAVGVGFGGEMTYGQTVGFIREPQTFWWGFCGLALKGAVWGLLGGAVLALGLVLDAPRRRRLPLLLAGFVAAVAVGWVAVNQTKLIYFSNLADRPREEVWCGLLAGALLLVWTSRSKLVSSFARAGFLGGLVGFGCGGLWIFIGAQWVPTPTWLPWWKLMEFTFGACFGMALGWAARSAADPIRQTEPLEESSPQAPKAWVFTLLALASAAVVPAAAALLPLRFSYAVVGALMLAAAAFQPRSRWILALAVTAAAFFADWAEDHAAALDGIPAAPAWTLAVLATAIFCVALGKLYRPGPLRAVAAFRLLVGAALATAWVKGLTDPHPSVGLVAEHALFAALACGLLWIELRNPGE